MNKKGMSLGFQIVLVVLFLLIVFGVVSGAFGLSFAKVKGFWVEIYDSMSGQIDDLKKSLGLMGEEEAAAKMKELGKQIKTEESKEETKTMRGFLTDAAMAIKERKYDIAINNYIKYYAECEKEYTPANRPEEDWAIKTGTWIKPTCHTVTRDGAKFRILNVLREKSFVSKKVPKYEDLPEDVKKIIKPEEFNPVVPLIKAAIDINEVRLNIKDIKNYEQYRVAGADKFNILYINILPGYSNLESSGDTSNCKNLLDSVVQIKALTNRYFSAFEMYRGDTILTASDYQFLRVPHDEINKLCEGMVITEPESAPEEQVLDDKCEIDNIIFEVKDATGKYNLYYKFTDKWFWSYDKWFSSGFEPKGWTNTNIVEGLNRNNEVLVGELNENPEKKLEGLKLLLAHVLRLRSNVQRLPLTMIKIYELKPSLVATNPYERPGNEVEYVKISSVEGHFITNFRGGKIYYKYFDGWSSHTEEGIYFKLVDKRHELFRKNYDEGICFILSDVLKR